MGVVKIYTNEQINDNIRKMLCKAIARNIYESTEFKQSITLDPLTAKKDTVQDAI
jgi:hypothetical protein